ncbi:pitrilysin [Orbaceae bacterium ESL0727]|nr:pitrilysin [Orbaceae bacterium ESL0727]
MNTKNVNITSVTLKNKWLMLPSQVILFVFTLLVYLMLICSQTFLARHALAIENKLTRPILLEKIHQSDRDGRQYEVIELDNKMRVLLVSDPNAAKSLASLALPVGSLQDPKNQQGLAHYTEHMVLMGSKKYPEPSNFSQFLSRHAGSYNASTAAYRTAFYFEVENSAFEPALDRLADAIAEPLLDPQFADKERNAVNAEMTMARSNDGFRIKQVDAETLNPAHPAAQFSGGNLETLSDKVVDHISNKLQKSLVNFYQNYYSANIMVGVIYSNQAITSLTKLAENTFGRIANKNVTVEPISVNALPPETLAKQISMIPAQPKKLLYLQFPIENNLAKFADKSDEYIAYMISNRSQNTLFDQLQKLGLIESIQADSDPVRYGNSGVFTITANLTDAGVAQKDSVIAAIFNYLTLIQKEGVSDDYYQEIKKVLALNFKYQSVERDMGYVEWLSDQMLLYPIQNVLDADYVANNFDKAAIIDRLKNLTIDNARIWLIAPAQLTNKKAYFVDAPYKIENISAEQKNSWLNRSFKFDLPELNPYIPDDFSLVAEGNNQQATSAFSPLGNHIHFPSHYFADEPKAAIALSLRSNQALSDVKSQVAFSLLDYLVGRNLAQLQFQASVAGMSLSTSSDEGLLISASGFSQHLPDMVLAILNSYQQITLDEQSLTLAKSWYMQQLDAADQAKSYSLAMQPVNALSSVPYFSRDLKRQTTEIITVNDIMAYRDKLLANCVPYMLSIGNISNQTSQGLYQSVKNRVGHSLDQLRSQFTPTPRIRITKTMDAKFTQLAASTDNALLMSYLPADYDEINGRVLSYTLYKIISPWFYDQLRSNEQLGYAVFAMPVYVGESSGIGFLIQSNQYDPQSLKDRYQQFYPVMGDKLARLSDTDIEQYKKGVIDELNMPPQTLDEEFERYMADFRLSRFSFDSRSKRIAQAKQVTKQDLVKFYQQSVLENKGLMLVSQVLGKATGSTKQPVAISDYHEFTTASQLQKLLFEQN